MTLAATASSDLAAQVAIRTAQANVADGVSLMAPEGGVRTAHEIHADLAPGDGRHELLVTITSGRAYANLERFDSLDEDGTPQPSVCELGIFPEYPIQGERGSIAVLANDLEDVAKISSAAAEFVRVYRQESGGAS